MGKSGLSMCLQRTVYFVRLGRPLHLIGGFVFNGLGIAIALYLGVALDWTAALYCQIVITAIQLMTHYSNDYFDQDADAAALTPTRWASGSRVLPDGQLSPHWALAAALVCAGIGLAAIGVLTINSKSPLLTFGLLLLALFVAWNYSGPPLWLNRRGLGEISAAWLVPGLTTLLAFQVQSGRLDWLPLLAVVPLCCFQFVMLLSVNFPDAAGDERVNKRTLVVIFGPPRTSQLFLLLLTFAYGALPLLVWWGLPLPVALAVLLTMPIAAWLAWRIWQGAAVDPDRWEGLGFWSIGLLLLGALLETAVFLALSV